MCCSVCSDHSSLRKDASDIALYFTMASKNELAIILRDAADHVTPTFPLTMRSNVPASKYHLPNSNTKKASAVSRRIATLETALKELKVLVDKLRAEHAESKAVKDKDELDQHKADLRAKVAALELKVDGMEKELDVVLKTQRG